MERAWREDVAPALKNGDAGNGRRSGATRPTREDGYTADSILARLKRDDPMTAQAPFLIPVAV